MKIPLLALLACFVVEPLACSREGSTPLYGSDLSGSDQPDNATLDQPLPLPHDVGVATNTSGANVGGANMTGGTGGCAPSSGGTGATGGTNNGSGGMGGTSP